MIQRGALLNTCSVVHVHPVYTNARICGRFISDVMYIYRVLPVSPDVYRTAENHLQNFNINTDNIIWISGWD